MAEHNVASEHAISEVLLTITPGRSGFLGRGHRRHPECPLAAAAAAAALAALAALAAAAAAASAATFVATSVVAAAPTGTAGAEQG